jgi:hypothetical protein
MRPRFHTEASYRRVHGNLACANYLCWACRSCAREACPQPSPMGSSPRDGAWRFRRVGDPTRHLGL